jgi:hypothetical protein
MRQHFPDGSRIKSAFVAGILENESSSIVMNWQERIVANLKVQAGKPVIKGTPLAV